MRSFFRDLLAAVFMGMILPGLMLNFAVMMLDAQEKVGKDRVPLQTQPSTGVQMPMRLRDTDGNVRQLDMDTYLVGAVLAEMPASFAEEALKAQAVVARTYARKAYVTGGKHKDGSVCCDPGCCQAYISELEYLTGGGTADSLDRIRSAVMQTTGQVLTYNEELIEATYFSCSGGSTEDAAAVWGTEFPYLQAVPSPGEEHATHYTDTVEFSADAFQQALDTELSGNPDTWFGTATYTEGGGVATMRIGGKTYSGTQLRSLLSLRSTAFTVETNADSVMIHTRGYGHRVGMSQYGADAMAVAGSSYEQILAHYYQGAELTNLDTFA